MPPRCTRRTFLAASAVAGASLTLTGQLPAAPYRTKLQKALLGTPDEATLKSWKAAGFEGIESLARNATPEEATAARKLAEKLDMRIHSVLYGWAEFNSPDRGKVAADLASVEVALKAAQAYGADTVLLVPCRVDGMAMPEPWEFQIEFDEKTSLVHRVAAGDNRKYQAYIDAQNHATRTTRAAVEKLIPLAEKTGVILALENVWNNLWVQPALCRNFVASFDHPQVRAYFDIGNHVKYAPSEEWIRTLGKLIVKCHVKDFRLNPDGHGGDFVDIRDGSVRWPVIREALDAIGYSGFLTIEGSDGLSLAERSQRLDAIIAGK